jgi:hypothetical protein
MRKRIALSPREFARYRSDLSLILFRASEDGGTTT